MTPTFDAITNELITALDEEIEVIKRSGGDDYVGLHDGQRAGVSAGRFLYSFLLDSDLFIPADTPAQLKAAGRLHDVTVVSLREFSITVSVKEDLGPSIPTAVLTLSPVYLLELLKTRLGEALRDQIRLNRPMVMRLFGYGLNEPIHGHTTSGIDLPGEDGEQKLNAEQLGAVHRCLEQRVSFIWGPPGTGKTRTIGRLARRLVTGKERVLLTSHTNVAIDSALMHVIKAFPEKAILEGAVIRVGQPQREEPELASVTLEAVVTRKTARLRERREELQARVEKATARKNRVASTLAAMTAIRGQRDKVESVKRALAQKVSGKEKLETGVAQTLQRIADLRAKLPAAESAGFFRRLLSGLDPAAIRSEIEAEEARAARLESDLKRTGPVIARAQDDVRNAEEELGRLQAILAACTPLPEEAGLRRQLADVEGGIRLLEQEIAAIDRDMQQAAASAIKEARVVGATLTRLVIMKELYEAEFDTVIVDEASMVPLPNLWFAAGRALERVVVTGDFRQLAPICRAGAREPMAQRWLQRDIFDQADLVDGASKARREDSRLCVLSQQYRMHPAIGDLANAIAYGDNPLVHSTQPQEYERTTHGFPEPGWAIVLCDTSGVNPWCAHAEPGASRYNIYSALVAVRLAAQALQDGAGKVGLVAPYRAHVRLVQQLVEEHGLDRDRLETATVHRFQGNEKDLIIFDLVDSPPYKLGIPLTGGFGSEAMRLLNVACTRAKGKLVVIAHSDYLSAAAPPGYSLVTMLQHIAQHGRFLDARSIVQDFGDPGIAAGVRRTTTAVPELRDLKDTTLFSEGTFYPAFMADLEGSGEEVVIFSPFVEHRRAAQIMPVLRQLLARGVSVTVVTREREPQESPEARTLIRGLADAGINILRRRGLHEKVAFLDWKVAWFGSLNILSQRSSTEQMIRFAQPEVVAKLAGFTGITVLLGEQRRKEARKERTARLAEVISEHMSVPRCPVCGNSTELRFGKYGPFYGCLRFKDRHCPGIVNVPSPLLDRAIADLGLECPACNEGAMVYKRGKNGAFIGCDRYPACRWTENF